jgi:hypothetical protein
MWEVFMQRTIIIILLQQRRNSAVKLQKVFTRWGCLIKTRLGIHDGVLDKCSNTGLVILEVVGEKSEKKKFAAE